LRPDGLDRVDPVVQWAEFQCWGHSSAGRAPALQAGGHRFDPDCLHHPHLRSKCGKPACPPAATIICHQMMKAAATSFLEVGMARLDRATFGLYRGMFEFGASVRRGIASPVCICVVLSIARVAVVLFFVSVNQVLLRLWTRVMDICPWGNSWIYESPVVRSIVLTGLVACKSGAPLGRISEWSETCERFYSTSGWLVVRTIESGGFGERSCCVRKTQYFQESSFTTP
jgi:hypothetical protein